MEGRMERKSCDYVGCEERAAWRSHLSPNHTPHPRFYCDRHVVPYRNLPIVNCFSLRWMRWSDGYTDESRIGDQDVRV